MEQYMLALDQGTTSSRAILYDKAGKAVATSQREFPQHFPKPGWVEHDANDIWLSTLACMSDVVIKSGISPKQVAGIGITNQRETTVVWDAKTGLPVHNAIVWQSRQSDDIVKRYKDMGVEEKIREKTGLVLDPYFSATKLVWLFENDPSLKERAKRGELRFGTIDSWLLYNLTGGKVHATDVTNACRTLLFNIHTMDWDPELLDLFGVEKSMLPEVKGNSEVYGTTAPYHFFGEEIPIAGMIGDQQAALFGQGCVQQGSMKNTYGTGGFLLMNTGSQPVQSDSGLLSTVGWQIGDNVTYALEGSIFVSGSLVQWLRDSLKLITRASQIEELAMEVPDSEGVVIVPAFTGLGAPYWDDKARGTILGLSRGSTDAHIARAALEAMAFQSNDLIEAMEKDTGMKIESMLVDGGASANNLLLQLQADLSGVPVVRPANREATALGAARMAGLAVGFWKPEDFQTETDVTFQPLLEKSEREAKNARWKQAVQACRVFEGPHD